MAGEAERVNVYSETINRMEPDIAAVDPPAALASIAISLKRLADSAADVIRLKERVDKLEPSIARIETLVATAIKHLRQIDRSIGLDQ